MNTLGDPQHEGSYFLRRDIHLRRQLRQKMEQRAAEMTAKADIAQGLGAGDEHLVERLHELGIDGEQARVLYLVPLVLVAWADGKVSDDERLAIGGLLETHRVSPGTPAARFIGSLLDEAPDPTLAEVLLELIHQLLAAKGLHPHSLIEACEYVAEASGGAFGFGDPVSSQERQAIARIAAAIRPEAQRQVVERLDR